MRKKPLLLAAFVAAFLAIAAPSDLGARSAHKSGKARAGKPVAASRRHKPVKAARKRTAGKRKTNAVRRPILPRRPSPLIFQDASGNVVLARFPTPPMYGPFLPDSLLESPELPCEPIDAVVEVRLHEPEGTAEGEGEPAQAESNVHADSSAGEPAGLARVARQLKSFFRPKSSAAVVKPQDVDLEELLSARFQIPVEGVSAEKLQDSFLSSRGRHHEHLAIDIGAPRGTPVLATTDGEIVRISRERRGGKGIYQKDASGKYLLFYCHLSRYAEGLAAGQKIEKGEVIGYVGSTGHVVGGPHLHFSITKLPDDDSSFKRGLAINPYLLFLAGVP